MKILLENLPFIQPEYFSNADNVLFGGYLEFVDNYKICLQRYIIIELNNRKRP